MRHYQLFSGRPPWRAYTVSLKGFRTTALRHLDDGG
jgi:hypothetical protein